MTEFPLIWLSLSSERMGGQAHKGILRLKASRKPLLPYQ